jgi:hypothetical protein
MQSAYETYKFMTDNLSKIKTFKKGMSNSLAMQTALYLKVTQQCRQHCGTKGQ